ncbi:GAF domain-containing protein, partial [Lysobacter xanthus]
MRQLLAQMSRSIDEARTLEALARPLLDMLQSLTGLESVFLTSVDTQGDRQRVRFVRNAGGLRIEEGMTASWRDAPCRRAMDEGRTQVDDAAERWGDIDLVRMLDLRTFVSVPVRTGDGALYGTLCSGRACCSESRSAFRCGASTRSSTR